MSIGKCNKNTIEICIKFSENHYKYINQWYLLINYSISICATCTITLSMYKVSNIYSQDLLILIYFKLDTVPEDIEVAGMFKYILIALIFCDATSEKSLCGVLTLSI